MLEELEEPNTKPPKSLLLSQRFKRPDLHGGSSSPPQTIATIPFQWEVAPGKPRSTTPTVNDPPPLEFKSIRSLDLPPRMFNSATSPTTVLHGPSGGIYSWCSPDRMVAKSKCMIKMPWSKSMRKEISSPKSSSWSWDSFQEFSSKGGGSSGSCSSYMSFDDLLNTLESRTKTNKVSRRRSFILFSRATSSIMESMHESINQAVPWRR
ncbi:hypothetical protein Tco_1319471 [Tanacetum coccineum]